MYVMVKLSAYENRELMTEVELFQLSRPDSFQMLHLKKYLFLKNWLNKVNDIVTAINRQRTYGQFGLKR